MECECAAAITSGRAACTAEWIANAAVFTMASPSTTWPFASTRMRSDWRMWLKLSPSGLTQKWSRCSGSRAVMWPARPSSNPNLPKRRNPAARRCLRRSRSSSTDPNDGRYVSATERLLHCSLATSRGTRLAHARSGSNASVQAYSGPVARQARQLVDPAVVVHDETRGVPGGREHGRRVATRDERGLRQDLRAPRIGRDDRHRRQPAVHGQSRAGVDEVVERAAVALPRAAQSRARRDRAGSQREHAGHARFHRVVDGHDPAMRLGRVAPRAEVAAEVDEDAADAEFDQLPGHEVGGVALADATEVERHTGGPCHRAHDRVEHDPGASRRGAGRFPLRARALAPDGVEVAVVVGGHHGREHGGVVPPARAVPGVDRVRDERERLGRDDDRSPRRVVQRAQFARRPEPAPHRLESLDRDRGTIAEVRTVEGEHGDVGAHRAELRRVHAVTVMRFTLTSVRVAALDLGTNSFHLLVADVHGDGHLEPLVREKEMLRLGDVVSTHGSIPPSAADHAVATVRRFRMLADAAGATEMLAKATSAIRRAANGAELVDRIEEETGVAVDVI